MSNTQIWSNCVFLHWFAQILNWTPSSEIREKAPQKAGIGLYQVNVSPHPPRHPPPPSCCFVFTLSVRVWKNCWKSTKLKVFQKMTLWVLHSWTWISDLDNWLINLHIFEADDKIFSTHELSLVGKMSLSECELHEAHFSNLLGQSNVYGLSNVTLPDGTTKVLVSPLKEKVLCVEYLREKGNLKPISRELQFAYIPGKLTLIHDSAISVFKCITVNTKKFSLGLV